MNDFKVNYAKRRRFKGQTPQDVQKQPQTQIISDHVSFFLYHVTPQVIIQIFFFFFLFREAVGMRNRRLPILHIFRSEENVSLLLQRYQIISIDSISCFKQKKNYRVFRKYKLFDTNYSLILTLIVPFFIITPQSFLSQMNENNNPRLPIISAISDLLT